MRSFKQKQKFSAIWTIYYCSLPKLYDPDERGNVLHLSNKSTKSAESMKATVAHEYFHHAQSHTTLAGNGSVFNIDITDNYVTEWLSEGTAMWFEGYLYDDMDGYISLLSNGDKILEKGLTSAKYSYQNVMFWKLISDKCTDFENNIKNLFYADFHYSDLYKIENMINVLSNSSCNFGDHLGAGKSSS